MLPLLSIAYTKLKSQLLVLYAIYMYLQHHALTDTEHLLKFEPVIPMQMHLSMSSTFSLDFILAYIIK